MQRKHSPARYKNVEAKVPRQRKSPIRRRAEDPVLAHLWTKLDALSATQEKRWPTQGTAAFATDLGANGEAPGLTEQETAAIAATRKAKLAAFAADTDRVIQRPVVSHACEYPPSGAAMSQPASWAEHRRHACRELSFDDFLYARYLFGLVDTARDGYIRLHDLVHFRVRNPAHVPLSAFEALKLRGDGKVYIDEWIGMFFPAIPRARVTAAVAQFEDSFNMPFGGMTFAQRRELKIMYEHLVRNQSNDSKNPPVPGRPFARIATRVLDRCHTSLDAIQGAAAAVVNRLAELRGCGRTTLDGAARGSPLVAIKALAKMASGTGYHMSEVNGGNDDDNDDDRDPDGSGVTLAMMRRKSSALLLGDNTPAAMSRTGRRSTGFADGDEQVGGDEDDEDAEENARTPSRNRGRARRQSVTGKAAAPAAAAAAAAAAATPSRGVAALLRRAVRNVAETPPPPASSSQRERGASAFGSRHQQQQHGAAAAAASPALPSPADLSVSVAAAGTPGFLTRGRRASVNQSALSPAPAPAASGASPSGTAATTTTTASAPPPGFTDAHLSLMDLFELLTEHEVVFSPCEIVHMLQWRGGGAHLHLEDVVRWLARAAVASARCAVDYETAVALVHHHMTTNPLASDAAVTGPLQQLVGLPLLRQLARYAGKLQVAGAQGRGAEQRIRAGLNTGSSLDVFSVSSSNNINNGGSPFGGATMVTSQSSVLDSTGGGTPLTAAPDYLATTRIAARSGTKGSVLDVGDAAALELDPAAIVHDCVSECPQCHDRTTAMCVSVAAGAKTVRDRKAAQSEAALKALLTCKCIMLDHPLFLLSAVVPFHAFQLLNQLIVAAPERALHRLPTVLSPAAALQLDSLELYRDSFVAGGRTFDLPNKSIVTKATFIEELLAETREFVAKKLRAVRMAAAKELERESKLDDGERAKLEAQRMARELEEQGLKSNNSSFALAAQNGGAAGLASGSSFVSASDMDSLSVKELVSHSRRHLAAAKDRISALAIDAHRMEKWSSPAAMDNFRRSRAAEERTSSPTSSPAASMLGKSAKSQKRPTPLPKK